MNPLWSLALYGLVAVGAIGAVWGVIHVHDNGVKTTALAPYQPIIVACKAEGVDPAGCAQEIATLKTANSKISAERLACDAKVTDLGKKSDAKLAETAAQLKTAKTKIASLETEKATLLTSLHPPVVGEACATTLGKINATNAAVGMRRLRDYGPASANVNTPARTGASAPTVRIGQ